MKVLLVMSISAVVDVVEVDGKAVLTMQTPNVGTQALVPGTTDTDISRDCTVLARAHVFTYLAKKCQEQSDLIGEVVSDEIVKTRGDA